MAKQTGRNERCPCGSGKKFKVCCGVVKSPSVTEGGWRQRLWSLAPVATVLVIIGFFVYMGAASDRASADGTQRVWDEAHGHYHTVPAASAPSAPSSAPPSAPPAGKVWSAEHGHWHDE